MFRNTAGQVIGAQMLTAAGADVTSGVSVVVSKDGAAFAAAGGTTTHLGSGFWTYEPTQAETDADHVAFQFTGGSSVTNTIQEYPDVFSNAVSSGAAVNTPAESYVLTTGTQSANTVTETVALDGVRHEHTDDAGTMDLYYEFDVSAQGLPTSVTVTGYLSNNNDVLSVYAWDWDLAQWMQIGTKIGQNAATNNVDVYTLFNRYVGTGADAGKVRIRFEDTGLTSATLAIDQIFVSYSVNNLSRGYEDQSVWLNTIGGTPGTVINTNGTVDNPVDTLADAITLVNSLGWVGTLHLSLGTDITLDQAYAGLSFETPGALVNLGGHAHAGLSFDRCGITGDAAVGASPLNFTNCEFLGSPNGLPPMRMRDCLLRGSLRLDGGGDYLINNCKANGPGLTLHSIDVNGDNSNARYVRIADFTGALQIENMTSVDAVGFIGNGPSITIAANCAGGTLYIAGNIDLVDNSGGAVTVVDLTRYTTKQLISDGVALNSTDGNLDGVPSVADIMAGGSIDGESLEGALRLIQATLVGELTGAGSDTVNIKGKGLEKVRVTASVDASGNRGSVTTDSS